MSTWPAPDPSTAHRPLSQSERVAHLYPPTYNPLNVVKPKVGWYWIGILVFPVITFFTTFSLKKQNAKRASMVRKRIGIVLGIYALAGGGLAIAGSMITPSISSDWATYTPTEKAQICSVYNNNNVTRAIWAQTLDQENINWDVDDFLRFLGDHC